MKTNTIDPIETIIVALFRFFEFHDVANKWEAESPTWAKYTSKIAKILTTVSSFTATSDALFNILPEKYSYVKNFLFGIAAINIAITAYANTLVKQEANNS